MTTSQRRAARVLHSSSFAARPLRVIRRPKADDASFAKRAPRITSNALASVRSAFVAFLVAVCLLVFVGCARRNACPPVGRDYPGVLRDPATITPDFLVRQTVEARHGAMSLSFDAALQKNGNTLTLIGFAPFGARAFVLKQTGSDVNFTQYLGRDLPFPPKYMLFDIDRAFFDEIPGGPHPDGEQSAQMNGEEVRETWAGGKLTERRFRRLDGAPAGEIVIRYQGGMVPPVPPSRVEFHNGWFGYDLAIDIHSYKRIEGARGTASAPPAQL